MLMSAERSGSSPEAFLGLGSAFAFGPRPCPLHFCRRAEPLSKASDKLTREPQRESQWSRAPALNPSLEVSQSMCLGSQKAALAKRVDATFVILIWTQNASLIQNKVHSSVLTPRAFTGDLIFSGF